MGKAALGNERLPEGMNPAPRRVKPEWAALGVGVVILGLAVFYLRSYYLSQVRLQESALERLTHQAEKEEAGLGYFFSERRDDLKNLALCREIEIYFENKALGMSMAYGLRASLMAVSEALGEFRRRKTFQGESIYDRIVFLDETGAPLGDTHSEEAWAAPFTQWEPTLRAEAGEPFLLVRNLEGQWTIVGSIPYSFKGRYAGQILTFLSAQVVRRYLVHSHDAFSNRIYGLIWPDGYYQLFPVAAGAGPLPLSVPLDRLRGSGPHPLVVRFPEGSSEPMYALNIPIRETPLSLLTLVPRSELMGAPPWLQPLIMGILGLLLMGASFTLWRNSTRNAVLHGRLEETSKREREILNANLSLQEEVAERTRVQAALRQSEERYRAIFESLQDVYFRTDEEGRITVISPSVRIEGGYEPEELIGRPVSDFVVEKAGVKGFAVLLTKTGVVSDFQLPLYHREGRLLHFSLNAHQLFNLDGSPNGMEGMLRNISTRKQQEEALEESRSRLHLALKGGDLAIWDWHLPTGEVSFDERWSGMLGYSPHEIEPHVRSWEQLIHPDDAPWVRDVLEEHLEGKRPHYETEHRMKSRSGEWKWILDRGQVVERDENGRPLRMAGTHLDITARKQAEEELRQYRENLETLVEERTSQLNETQRQLINRAMESGRAQLAAMVLHNIGNAFTPVNVYVYQLKDDGLERISRHLDHCMAELNRHHFELQRYVLEDPRGGQVFSYLGDLVQALGPVLSQRRAVTRKIDEAIAHISEILTLQHAYAAGEHELKELVSLNSLVEDAVRMQAGALEKRGIRTVSDLDPALPRLLIDKSRLIQVIVNFIKNSYEAIDALNGSSEDRWIALRSSCRAAAVVLEIEDNGAGIEPELMDRLFDFGRSSKGSSGFGLYYCRMFVEANGGTLGLSSPGRGKGAAVRVVLPLRGGLGQLESRSVSEP